MKESSTAVYILILFICVVVSAFKEYPYLLAAASILLIVKQLGRINTTLRNKGDNR